MRRSSGRRAQRVRVDIVAVSDAGRDEARRFEPAVEVQEDRLAALAAQVSALAKLPEEAVELLVEDRRRVAAGLPSDGKRKRIRFRLPRKGDLDLRHGSRWYLGGA